MRTNRLLPRLVFCTFCSAEAVLDFDFEPLEAFRLVFDHPKPSAAVSQREERLILTLDGEWKISFPGEQPSLEHPFDFSLLPFDSVRYDRLRPWSEWGLAAYSGVVDYEISFELPPTAGALLLDLGDVLHSAAVSLNGTPIGERLRPPFRFELNGPVPAGKNVLGVRVENLLNNA